MVVLRWQMVKANDLDDAVAELVRESNEKLRAARFPERETLFASDARPSDKDRSFPAATCNRSWPLPPCVASR